MLLHALPLGADPLGDEESGTTTARVALPQPSTLTLSIEAAGAAEAIPSASDQRRNRAQASTPTGDRPRVTILAPEDGATVRGEVQLELAGADDQSEQRRLTIRVDDSVFFTGPFRSHIGLGTLSRGTHTIEAQIDDPRRQVSSRHRIAVHVQQTSRLLPPPPIESPTRSGVAQN